MTTTDPYSGLDPFAGPEPVVGELRAVRSFRIGSDGSLHPLFHDTAWTTETVTAECGLRAPAEHVAPEPDCVCGLYAYASEAAAREDPHSRHALAVVSCWGRVVAGSRGLRAQHARIEALWLSPRVPPAVRARVRARYPWVELPTDRATMLREHPPTRLDCYDADRPDRRRVGRVVFALTAMTALVLGAFPSNWIWWHPETRIWWLVELAAFAGGAGLTALFTRTLPLRGACLTCTAMVLWLLAPFAGLPGMLLLRLPVAQIAVLGAIQRRRAARAAGRLLAPT